MKKGILPFIIAILSIGTMLTSCGKDVEESTIDAHKRYLKSFVQENYPSATLTDSGIYLLDSIPGTGEKPQDESYVLVDYTVTYLDGYYMDYTSEEIAKQLGTFSYAKFYGPRIWNLENQESGIKEIVSHLREGGTIKAILPPWLLGEETENTTSTGDGASRIYTIKLHDVIEDVIAYQDSIMRDVANNNFIMLDTTSAGFYFRKTKVNPQPKDTVANEESVKIRYIGKYLDGKVFDTNIADTAKKYGIYSECSYDYLIFKHFEREDDAIGQNSLVEGFSKALWRMHYSEKAITFFNSEYGYGENGSGNIPGYTPLMFEIWYEEEEKTDE